MTAKQRARARLIQALYRWQMGSESVQSIEQEYLSKSKKEDNFSKSYFQKIYANIAHQTEALNQTIAPFLDRSAEELGAVEQAILWLGCYELFHIKETPTAVVINEAIELAKQYGAEGSYKYINSILDKVLISINKTID